jgi:hypothetical protein
MEDEMCDLAALQMVEPEQYNTESLTDKCLKDMEQEIDHLAALQMIEPE